MTGPSEIPVEPALSPAVENDAQVDDNGGPGAGEGVTKKERSQIKFPYTDIDDAVSIASTIKERRGGGAMALDQLAAALGGTSIKSGAFRTKVATAVTFGAVKPSRGAVELTDLGHRLADEDTRGAALVEAFLNVPLYKRIYERYQGKSLPGDSGLAADIREFGVVETQADRARQAMQRSADKAGFFWGGRSRLIIPTGVVLDSTNGAEPESEAAPPVETTQVRDESVLSNALLRALFEKMLPPEKAGFPARDRKRFFRALAVNLDVIYGEPADGELDSEALAKLFTNSPPTA